MSQQTMEQINQVRYNYRLISIYHVYIDINGRGITMFIT